MLDKFKDLTPDQIRREGMKQGYADTVKMIKKELAQSKVNKGIIKLTK